MNWQGLLVNYSITTTAFLFEWWALVRTWELLSRLISICGCCQYLFLFTHNFAFLTPTAVLSKNYPVHPPNVAWQRTLQSVWEVWGGGTQVHTKNNPKLQILPTLKSVCYFMSVLGVLLWLGIQASTINIDSTRIKLFSFQYPYPQCFCILLELRQTWF